MFKDFVAACLVALLPVGSLAAPVSSPVIDVPSAVGEFIISGDRGNFLSFDAFGAGQGFIAGDLLADLGVSFDLADPYTDVDGFFALRDDGVAVLNGILSSVVPQTDMLSLVFTKLSGDLASTFGSSLAVELFFFDILSDDPLAALAEGMSYQFAYVVEGGTQPAPIPLPAGGPLLLSALGLLAWRQRFKPTA